ncbi:MAG: acyltransferase [Saprospiraceae bacterium]
MYNFIQNLPSRLQRNTSGGNYYPLIDGMRWLAIFPVLMQHLAERLIKYTDQPFSTPIDQDPFAFFISRGTIGVFIFFAISGFILGMPFAKAHLVGGKKVNLGKFYLRRLTRLEPPYLIWMSVFGLVLAIKGFGEGLLGHWLASMTYTHNMIYGYYSPLNPVAWSLEVEIQFYLIAPFLAAFFFSISNTLKRRLSMVAGIIFWTVLVHQMGWQYFPYKPSLLAQLPHFLTGFLLLDFFLNKDFKIKNSLIWDVLAIAAYFIMAYTWTEELGKSLVFAIALFSFFFGIQNSRFIGKWISSPWIAAFGGMCYTIYLTHLPLMELFTPYLATIIPGTGFEIRLVGMALVMLPIVLSFSVLAYLFIEKPFMKIRPEDLRIVTFFKKSFQPAFIQIKK